MSTAKSRRDKAREMEQEIAEFCAEVKACPCGNRFKLIDLKPGQLRMAGGKYLNKSVERSGLSGRVECQCPKCLLWFDTLTQEVI